MGHGGVRRDVTSLLPDTFQQARAILELTFSQ